MNKINYIENGALSIKLVWIVEAKQYFFLGFLLGHKLKKINIIRKFLFPVKSYF